MTKYLCIILLFLTAAVPSGMSISAYRAFSTKINGIDFHIIDIFFSLTLIFFLLDLTLRGRISFGKVLSTPISLFLIVCVFAGIYGYFNKNSLWCIFRDLRGFLFYLSYFAFYHCFRQKKEISKAIEAVIIGSIVYSVFVLFMYFSPPSLEIKKGILTYWQGVNRVYFRNSFVLIFSFVYATFAGLVFSKRNYRFLFCGQLFLIAILLSQTRSIISMALLGLFLSIMFQLKKGIIMPMFKKIFIAYLCLGVFITIGFAMVKLETKVGQNFKQLIVNPVADVSLKGRIASYNKISQKIFTAPIFGFGMGALIEIPWTQTRRFSFMREYGKLPGVDNTFLTLWYKVGLFGSLFFMWIYFQYLRVVRCIIKEIDYIWKLEQDKYIKLFFISLYSVSIPYFIILFFQNILIQYRIIIIVCAFLAITERMFERLALMPRSSDEGFDAIR